MTQRGNDPRFQLPAGRLLTSETEVELMEFWEAQSFRTLTAQEIEDIVGDALPVPSIKRDFQTGRYPVRFNRRH